MNKKHLGKTREAYISGLSQVDAGSVPGAKTNQKKNPNINVPKKPRNGASSRWKVTFTNCCFNAASVSSVSSERQKNSLLANLSKAFRLQRQP